MSMKKSFITSGPGHTHILFLNDKDSLRSFPFFNMYMVFKYLRFSFMETLVSHRVGGNRKRSKQSTNADQKSIETVFSIVICRLLGDKLAIENSVSNDFYLRSSIVFAFSIAVFPVWYQALRHNIRKF